MIFRFSPSSLSSSSIPVIRTTMHLAHTMSHFLYYTSPTKSLTCTITHICECTNKMLSEMNELAQDLVSGKLQSQDSNTVLERPALLAILCYTCTVEALPIWGLHSPCWIRISHRRVMLNPGWKENKPACQHCVSNGSAHCWCRVVFLHCTSDLISSLERLWDSMERK